MNLTRFNAKDIGVWAALTSAFLFGAGTPLAKGLLGQVSPWLLAGLLYAGSGVGLLIFRTAKKLPAPRLNQSERVWLVAAVVCGGVAAPVLLMFGLSGMAAGHASLLLNAEAVLTTLLAWALFKEHLGSRIVLGMALIVAGALLLSWPLAGIHARVKAPQLWPVVAVVLACTFWALDNNFTRKIAHSDASWIACVKGLSAGLINLLLAFLMGTEWPSLVGITAAMLVGFLAYGVSLALFVVALRHLGTSRTGAYFSTAPFVGAIISIVFFAESVTWQLGLASALMGLGVWLHLTEDHGHLHRHDVLTHTHAHTHDDHHRHDHPEMNALAANGVHSHTHQHEPLEHSHAHFPDAHHRHQH